MNLFGSPPAFLAYVAAYALAAVGCGIGLYRATRMEDPDTRRGMVGLLVCSGGWAALELGPDRPGRWGAFPRQPHRRACDGRRVAVLPFGVHRSGLPPEQVVPCGRCEHASRPVTYSDHPPHGLYFATRFVADPFPHRRSHTARSTGRHGHSTRVVT